MIKEAKAIIVLFGLACVGYTVKLATSVFIARHVSVAVFGDFNLAIKVLNVFVTITMFGSNFSANRFLAKYIQQNKDYEASRYIAWNMKLLSVTFIVSFIISLIAFLIMSWLHIQNLQRFDEYHLVVYTLWLFPFAAISAVAFSYLECNKQVTASTFFKKILKYLSQLILFVAAVMIVGPMLQPTSLVFVLFFAFVIIGSLSIFSMNKELTDLFFPSIKQLKHAELSEGRGTWIRTSARLTINSMLFTFICAADLVLIELISNKEQDVGYYSAAMMICALLFSVAVASFRKIKPDISTLLAHKKTHKELQHRLNTTNLLILVSVLLLTAFIFIFNKHILLLFGPEYVQAKNVLNVLAISTICACFASTSSIVLALGGYDHLIMKITIIQLIITVILIAIMTYIFGIIGTAAAMGISAICKLLINAYHFRTKLNLRLFGIV